MEIKLNINKKTLSPTMNKLVSLNEFRDGEKISSTGELSACGEKEQIGDSSFGTVKVEAIKVKEEYGDLPWPAAVIENKSTSPSSIKMEPKWDDDTEQFSKDALMYEQDEEQKPDLIFLLDGQIIETDKKYSSDYLHPTTNLDGLEKSSSNQIVAPVKTEMTEIIEEIEERKLTACDEWNIKSEVVDCKEEGFQQNKTIDPSGVISQENCGEYKEYKCHICEFQTKWKGNFKYHLDQHKNPEEIKILKCEYKIFHSDDLKMDSNQHGEGTESLAFDQCKYQTTHKRNLKRHIARQHKNKVYTFKCNYCDYQGCEKTYWKLHLLQHKPMDEIDASDKFKCNQCEYETLRKGSLKRHLLRHMNIEDIDASNKFKCNQCEYQTAEKGSLRQHIVVRHILVRHKYIKELKEPNIFKCNYCDYQTARKSHLKTHLLRHKNIEDVAASDKFKCCQCEYETIDKSAIKQHTLLRHKNIQEGGALKCNYCNYLTPRKSHLKKHLLRHKNIEEVDVSDKFKCDQCEYQTLEKGNLNKHKLLRHKTIEEVEIFQCNQCKYSSRLRSNLKKHLIRHKNREESNFVKCTQCEYQTRLKSNLKKHLLQHEKQETNNLLQCTECDFQTLSNPSLKKHIRKHK